MSAIEQHSARNLLLRQMSCEDFARLAPHLKLVPTHLRMPVYDTGVPVTQLHFPEQGFTSLTTGTMIGSVEIGMIGREGLVGASPILHGVYRAAHPAFVQMAGANLTIDIEPFEDAVSASPSLRDLLLRYTHTLMIQMAYTATSNGVYEIQTRLARWLLMCHDRSDNDEIGVTHEFLADMLGVRRPGVTIAVQVAEGDHLIKAKRGLIRILDRAGLERAAVDSYGAPEAEYATVMGMPIKGLVERPCRPVSP